MCDSTFYGPVPQNLTRDQAIQFLANGVKNYLEARPNKMPREIAVDMVDMWFEHDASGKTSKFSHLFDDDDDDSDQPDSGYLGQIVDMAFKMANVEGKPEYDEDEECDEDLVGPYPRSEEEEDEECEPEECESD